MRAGPDNVDPVYYYIVNKHSGLVLDVRGGSTNSNTQVMQWRLLATTARSGQSNMISTEPVWIA
jgi:hypothetical protein